MNFLSDLSSLGLSTTLVVMLLTSILLWLFIRKRIENYWLPILKVIRINEEPLPKLQFHRPLLVPFLCFIVAGCVLIFLSLEPHSIDLKNEDIKSRRIHILLDMSPSTSSIDSSVLKDKLSIIYDKYRAEKISISATGQTGFISPKSDRDVFNWLGSVKHHRAGLKMGEAIKEVLEKFEKLDNLIIVSDSDRNTWSGFNWSYLADSVKISHLNIEASNYENYFIDKVSPLEDPTRKRMMWEVVISRNYSGEEASGEISLPEISYSVPWTIPSGELSISITFKVPRDLLDSELSESENLTWVLNTEAHNALRLDDQFRSYTRAKISKALLVSKVLGEMKLEDPMHHLIASLETNGLDVKRVTNVDNISQYWDYPIWILDSNEGSDLSFCPSSLLNSNSSPGVDKPPVIWLLPGVTRKSYKSLCECYANIFDLKKTIESNSFCSDVETRDQYISILRSTGSTQIGGSVTNELEALAWNRKIGARGNDVYAFTRNMSPLISNAISYGSLPLVINSFIKLSGISSRKDNKSSIWPRFEQVSKTSNRMMTLSNVPRSESLLRGLSREQLPPRFPENTSKFDNLISLNNSNKNSFPWIDLSVKILCLVFIIEGVWLLIKNPQHFLLLIALLSSSFTDQAIAKVRIEGVGYKNINAFSVRKLSRDVSSRTSITVSDSFNNQSKFDLAGVQDPWLWVHHPNILRSLSNDETRKLRLWLSRGGFLILENFDERLSSIQNLHPLGAEWKPIPPDHEVMRSFHLLDSLPKCQNLVWQGLHADHRLVAVAIPYSLLDVLVGNREYKQACSSMISKEQSTRIFINILMVALTTDYKKDQIHLPEILKRLR